MVISVNKIRCNACEDVIESTHVHDFKWCKCHAVFVDGGPEYLRRGGQGLDFKGYTEMSEHHTAEEVADALRDHSEGMPLDTPRERNRLRWMTIAADMLEDQ